MEHRWNVRIPIKTAVAVCYPGQRVAFASGLTRDMSVEGAYVETDSKAVPENTVVYVRFPLQDTAEDQSLQMPAFVTRSDTGGLGLMFVNSETEAARRLIEFLRCQLYVMLNHKNRNSIG